MSKISEANIIKHNIGFYNLKIYLTQLMTPIRMMTILLQNLTVDFRISPSMEPSAV
ncbi:MAG: hypothetical protein ACSHW7_04065 [Patiriisocius sp.]|uniref:hypothetical protein n=1 Tax=Patiriisocius sp. TaxID=2822396 RepID=UPI003EF82B2B